MQIKILLVLLCVGKFALAQPGKHVKVPGTKCRIIPPEGFITATAFSGFQDPNSGAAIMINEMPAPYQTLVDGFTAEALKTKGMTLISKQQIEVNNTKATLFKVAQSANGVNYEKLFLLFGDASHTVFVNGMYTTAARAVESSILASLQTVIYNAGQDDAPLEAATFTINTDQTEYKLVKYMSGFLLYTVDGKIPTEKPLLTVGNSLSKIPLQNQRLYAQQRIKQFPGADSIAISENEEVTIDNLKGYEIVGKGKDKNNKPLLVYQVILYTKEGDYYLIYGQANENFDKNLQAYKTIAASFKRK